MPDPTPSGTSQPTNPTAPGCSCNNSCPECGGVVTDSQICNGSNHPSSYSAEPVRYSNGEILMVSADLAFKSFGVDWGHTRSYSNRVSAPNVGRNGNSWFVKEWPCLVPSNLNLSNPNTPGTICLVWVVQESLWFDYSSGSYTARFFVKPKLSHDATAPEFTLKDSEGRVTRFFDFSAGVPVEKRGRFKSFTDAAGRETVATYNNTSNVIESFVQTGEGQSSGYYYTYATSGANAGRLNEVLYQVNDVPVRKAAYTYYDGSTANGSLGDLEKATISKYDESAWVAFSNTYYRYYKQGDADGVKLP